MKIPILQGFDRLRQRSALTLIEIMVASSLLLVILVSLMLMFNQTQRAFRTGLRQNDVMENGRAALDAIASDIEEMAAAHRLNLPNAQVQLHSDVAPLAYIPPGGGGLYQTQYLQTFFFLKQDGDWNALGYRVLNSTIHTNRLAFTNEMIIGALYVFHTNSPDIYEDEHLRTFHGQTLNMVTNRTMRRLVDGVVHFKVTMYDQRGMPYTNSVLPEVAVDAFFNGLQRVNLFGSTLPAMVDLELGIVEPQTLEVLRPLIAESNDTAVRNYLMNHSGKIHIFRRQIPIRTALR